MDIDSQILPKGRSRLKMASQEGYLFYCTVRTFDIHMSFGI